MSDQVGCGDNSCVFNVIKKTRGMGTNGGCRCFDPLESWVESENRWNRAEVSKVRRDVMLLAREVADLRKLLAEAREVAREVRRHANSTPYAQWDREQHQADIVCEKIDAALAKGTP